MSSGATTLRCVRVCTTVATFLLVASPIDQPRLFPEQSFVSSHGTYNNLIAFADYEQGRIPDQLSDPGLSGFSTHAVLARLRFARHCALDLCDQLH